MNAADAVPRLNNALTGRYQVAREIGAGGMATVYLARDIKHDRNVALKVLKPELGAVLGVERFLSEIKVTANLQHPNLLPLFDSGEADGLLFYVMPFVEGETLRAKLDREKQLPIDEAVHIATAVASALEYAHKAGVIHRDLKPENILIQSGQPVIADFGIALAVSRAGGQRVTESGLSLGTPQYMSPEQATADRAIDARSDIYSLGAVTYEMLTGEPPHTGSTAQAIISRIMTETPRPVRASRAAVPLNVEEAVHTALAKLPADRFGDAAAFAAALNGRSTRTPAVTTVPSVGRGRNAVQWSVLAIAVIAVGFSAWRMSPLPPDPRVFRFAVPIPANQPFLGNISAPVAVAPDGKAVVYVGRGPKGVRALYYRRLDASEGVLLAGTDDADIPVFSPDGEWIAFRNPAGLNKMSVHSGTPIVLNKNGGTGISWGFDDAIYAGSADGLYRVSTTDGARRRVSSVDTANHRVGQYMPLALSDGKNVLVWTRGENIEQLAMVRIADGHITTFEGDATNPIGLVDGYLVFGRTGGSIGVVPFDPKRTRSVAGVLPMVEAPLRRQSGGTAASVSVAGDFVYVSSSDFSRLRRVDVHGQDLGGRDEERYFTNPVVSPDGREVVIVESTGVGGASELWIHDVASGVMRRLPTAGSARAPSWTADGRRVVYVQDPEKGPREVWWMPIDRSAPPERLVATSIPINQAAMAPDGQHLVVETYSFETKSDLYMIDLHGDRTPMPLERTPFGESEARISPDGHWLAYVSNETERVEVYVRPFPGNGAHVQVSANGGSGPRWTRDSRGLVYHFGERFEKAHMAVGPNVSVARIDTMFTGVYGDYDVDPGGFLWILRPNVTSAEIMVVTNWIAEIKARVAKK